jgi:adenosylcobinamide-phosphate synthase
MELLIVLIIALIIDLSFGELPSKIHPVVWMGKYIDIIKKSLFNLGGRLSGILLTVFLLLVFLSLFYLIIDLFINFHYLLYIVVGLLISTTFSIKFLLEAVNVVSKDLKKSLEKARASLSMLVSRNTSQLTTEEVCSATVESLTENLTDSVTAPIFYLAIFGILGVILQKIVLLGTMEESYYLPVILGVLAAVTYRVINTLDAMVGYKNKINMDIGWFPAKADDYLNFFPARLTGVLIVISSSLMGLNWRKSWQMMIRDASNTPSPNSGYPMAAAAGALEVQLIKPGVYILGDNTGSFNLDKITEALLLSKIAITIFLALIIVVLAIWS